VDDADSWLLLAFTGCLAFSAFFSNADLVFISLPKAAINPVAHLVYLG
jgi:hypothetical protein